MQQLLMNEDGATALEYGLIAALIAAAITGAVLAVGTNISTIFQNLVTAMSAALH